MQMESCSKLCLNLTLYDFKILCYTYFKYFNDHDHLNFSMIYCFFKLVLLLSYTIVIKLLRATKIA